MFDVRTYVRMHGRRAQIDSPIYQLCALRLSLLMPGIRLQCARVTQSWYWREGDVRMCGHGTNLWWSTDKKITFGAFDKLGEALCTL